MQSRSYNPLNRVVLPFLLLFINHQYHNLGYLYSYFRHPSNYLNIMFSFTSFIIGIVSVLALSRAIQADTSKYEFEILEVSPFISCARF